MPACENFCGPLALLMVHRCVMARLVAHSSNCQNGQGRKIAEVKLNLNIRTYDNQLLLTLSNISRIMLNKRRNASSLFRFKLTNIRNARRFHARRYTGLCRSRQMHLPASMPGGIRRGVDRLGRRTCGEVVIQLDDETKDVSVPRSTVAAAPDVSHGGRLCSSGKGAIGWDWAFKDFRWRNSSVW